MARQASWGRVWVVFWVVVFLLWVGLDIAGWGESTPNVFLPFMCLAMLLERAIARRRLARFVAAGGTTPDAAP